MKTKINSLLVLIAVTFFTGVSYSQKPIYLDNTPQFTIETDNMLQNMYVDRAYPILYDRVFPLAALTAFNKRTVDTTNNIHFLQSYYELYHAAYNKSIFKYKPSEFSSSIAVDVLNGIVPIGALSYDILSIDTNAIEKNLLYQNGNFIYNVPGADQAAPLISSTVYLASPLVASSKSQHVLFKLAGYMFKRPSQYNLYQVDADFGNGQGLQTNLSINNAFAIDYPSPGNKTIKFKLWISRARQTPLVIDVVAKFKVNASTNQSAPATEGEAAYRENISADESYGGYTGQGNLSYYYAFNNTTNKVKKPILVLDGFDPTDSRKDVQLYDNYLNRGNFAHDLRSQGYDIVVLNFPDYVPQEDQSMTIHGGGDYIQRNGTVCMATIKLLNQKLQANGSIEKLVVIGPSMGGLISRYALRTLENRGINHNCRLWISLDSPHNGANISIGSQYFIDYMAGLTGSKELNDAKEVSLNCPAALQLLLSHFSAYAPPVRNAFQNEMNALGFPRNLRRIAIADGNLSGLSTLGNGCDKTMTFDLTWQVYSNNKIKIFGATFVLKINIKTASLVSSKSYYDPSRGACAVFQVTKFGFQYTENGKNNALTGLDVAPGGYTDTQAQIASGGGPTDIIGGWAPWLKQIFNVTGLGLYTHVSANFYSVMPNHSFISTKSALAFSGSNKDLGENIYNRNLVCSGETPFDGYYAPATGNLEHVYITSEMKNYASKEINGIVQPSSFNINAASPVIGDDFICAGNIKPYTVTNLPAGATVNWTLSGPIQFNGSNTGATTQIKPTGNGAAVLTANVTSSCGNYSSFKNINVGVPGYPVMDHYNGAGDPFYTIYYKPAPGGTYVDESVTNSNPWNDITTTGIRLRVTTSNQNPYKDTYLRSRNSCGAGPSLWERVIGPAPFQAAGTLALTDNNNTIKQAAVTVFPNPVSQHLVININSLTAVTYTISLYDLAGKKILTSTKVVEPGVNIITLDVGKVNNGIYLLAVDNGFEIKNEKITIAH